jgi:hypothetical protein
LGSIERKVARNKLKREAGNNDISYKWKQHQVLQYGSAKIAFLLHILGAGKMKTKQGKLAISKFFRKKV